MAEVQTIDSRIAVYLRRANLTQEELAQRVSLSGVQFGRKRRGEYDWRLSELVALAEIMGMSTAELLTEL